MRRELEIVLQSIGKLPAMELARLRGEIAELDAHVMMQMTTPAPPKTGDRLLDVTEAAERMGVSRDYLYRHADEFAFTKRTGRKLQFRESGIDSWVKR